ncbi:hypothetical protein EG68_05381 [Paragonimus skrjabini miyazakii]|uniref:Uncharacterized protein n=1 Tax=Paragonimus skrjabini miyazakii TaxID=59628 RepID=A0A8S9YAR8_9TREM|nr:hypothetical protein EG68_05381 [Paragonimus skrjabini miyazakii]
MGVHVSKPVKKLKPHIIVEKMDHEVPCRVRPIQSPEPQRNDNATKLMERDRAILFSPIPLSPGSSVSSTSSFQCPRLGPSPVGQTKYGSTTDMTNKADNCWFEQNHDPQICDSLTKLQHDTRPPRKPCSVVPNRYERRMLHTNGSIKSRYMFSDFPYKNGLQTSKKHRNLDRQSVSSSSLAILCDARLQLGEAHLRRCTAAQQVQANKPDILDSLSVHNYTKTNLRTPLACESGKLHSLRKNCATTTGSNIRWKNVFREVHNATIKGKHTPCTVSEISKSHTVSVKDQGIPSMAIQQAVQGDTFPLRYQFYIEDRPSTVRAFTSGGKLTALARDSHCDVHFQAQCNQSIPFGQNVQSDRSGSHRIMRPILYYQGKRVRPVTVAARNMTELRQFLELLDSHYPELKTNLFGNEDKSVSSSPPSIDDKRHM